MELNLEKTNFRFSWLPRPQMDSRTIEGRYCLTIQRAIKDKLDRKLSQDQKDDIFILAQLSLRIVMTRYRDPKSNITPLVALYETACRELFGLPPISSPSAIDQLFSRLRKLETKRKSK